MRWNYPICNFLQQQHTKNNSSFIRSYSQPITNTRISAISTSSILSSNTSNNKDSLKNVMFLNCWGPN
ncbi:hypothetical protein RDABS01_007911 [Bienertia sinuspersici]